MPPSLPPPVPEPEPVPIPVAAVLAPALAGAVLAAATGSSLPLALAALGPLIAIASLADGRWQRRRSRRRALRRRAVALERLSEDLTRDLAARRAALLEATPTAASLLARQGAALPPRVLLGWGPVPSGIVLDPVAEGDEAFAEAAAVIEDAPVTAEREAEVAVLGPRLLAAAVARALRVQGARAVASGEGREAEEAQVVLRVDGVARARVLAHPDPAARVPIRPELVSASEERASLRTEAGSLADLGVPDPATGLVARFAVARTGPLDVDLAAEGPHAVIGGTTGSGKSELLLSWVVALARAHPPDRLSILLLDFKGGATFDALAALPHVAGVVSDLDEAGVERLATGLRAELRRREEVLRERGARDLGGVPELSRLVVVVDEFAALLRARPVLGEVFADLAARGRTLGISLVLCTQRPAGVVSEALLANCGLRISLRVLSAEDSRSVVGVPDAAALSRTAPGRCLLSRSGDAPIACRVVPATLADVEEVARRWAGRTPADPVWLAPLPAAIDLPALPAARDGLVVGMLDLPEERRRSVASWRPDRDGALVAVGRRGSGRTTLLAALAAQEPEAVRIEGAAPEGPEALWDALTAGEAPPLLLVDDLDLALGGLPDEYAVEAADRLALALRGRGLRLAATARAPLAAPLRPLAGLAGRLLVLATGRDDHAALIGGAAPFDPRLPPGGGWWSGTRIQIARSAEPGPAVARPLTVAVDLAAPLVVVTRFPARRLAQLRRLVGDAVTAEPGPSGIAVVGVDEFTSSPALWPLVGRLPVLLDGCSSAEHRAVTRRRELPPLLAPLPGRAWLVRPEQPTVRASVEWGG